MAHDTFRPVLFLDFDGVLNHASYLLDLSDRGHGRNGSHDPAEEIDPSAVARVNRIVSTTGCFVVCSSAWRLLYRKSDLNHYLEQRGAEFRLLDVTPDDSGSNEDRGHQIQRWLTWHRWPTTRIAILDDNSDMAHLLHRLVLTDATVGLQDEQADRAIAMLRRPMVGGACYASPKC